MSVFYLVLFITIDSLVMVPAPYRTLDACMNARVSGDYNFTATSLNRPRRLCVEAPSPQPPETK